LEEEFVGVIIGEKEEESGSSLNIPQQRRENERKEKKVHE